jgi:rubredoxin
MVVDGTLTIEKSDVTPNTPELAIETHMLKLTYVELPEDWAWEDETLGLVEGENEVVAKYVGADAGNYTTEKVTITITRLACQHDGEHVILGAKEATCTVDGYTGDLSCSICGLVYEQGAVIPAKGHDAGEPVEENRKEPTCLVAGSVDSVVYCTIDHEELSRQTYELPATGHIAGEKVAENYVAPTKTETGSVDSVVYCTVDGEELSRESFVLPVLPDEGTAISDVAGDETIIYAYGHTIVVETTLTGDIIVNDMNGRIVAKSQSNGDRTEIYVPKVGVYAVRIGTVSQKVAIR